MSIQKIKNSLQALAHLRKELSEGGTLAKLVLSRTDFTPGEFLTGFPGNVDQSQLDFRSSIRGLPDEPTDFAKLIRSFIHDPLCVVLVEDIDPFPLEEDSPYKTRAMRYDTELYWRMSGLDLSETDILDLLAEPDPYPSSAFFSIGWDSPHETQLTDSDLQRAANYLVGVAVRAFDGDSFLIWWREDLRPFPSA
jgi:hypothetical protein